MTMPNYVQPTWSSTKIVTLNLIITQNITLCNLKLEFIYISKFDNRVAFD